ncbi:MAG TPA: CapA family protein [Candidatus Sulfomarinibacteraceae bacterium]|nr:CapA family protein [Candidatus Sulfomarinibacteraceae bacterium]
MVQRPGDPATPAPSATMPASHVDAGAAVEPTVIPSSTATEQATIAPSPSPTPAPTETPPPLVMAVPPLWQQASERATAQLTSWPGQIRATVSEAPTELLTEGRAQLALIATDDGYRVGQQPLAITVPFSSDWEQITLAEAQEIAANGHAFATVVPWTEIEPRQRALYVDGWHVTDPQYPLQQQYALLAAPGYEPEAAALAEHLKQHNPFNREVQLAAVGDVMLDRDLGTAIAAGDLAFPFAHVKSIFLESDLALANLECALGDVGEAVDKSYTFRAPPSAARSLAAAGFDIVSLANNHAMDYGPAALLQGIDLLRGSGIAVVGAGADARAARAPAFVTNKDLTIAFLGYANVPVEGRPPYFDTRSWTAGANSPGLAWADSESIENDVNAARARAEHVVVLLHSGYEYVPGPSPEQRAAARAAIDAGAALVIGHHAHILQGVEFYGDGVIVYGLGNFAFTITGPPETAILRVWLDERGVRQLDFVPAIIQASGQPRLATADEASAIRRHIYALSAGLQ